jgi:hypothetical protein
MNKTLLVVLQNAYGVEEGYRPSYERESFVNCHTGRRLREALPTNCMVEIINSNPAIGNNPDSCFKPAPEYVKDWIAKIKPDVILVCGKVAKKTMQLLTIDIPTVYMPHPAYRALSKQMTSSTRNSLLSLLEE